MADKIPHEVLLPVALELYKKVPQERLNIGGQDDCAAYAMRLAENFANFYHKLHEKLANHQQ